MWKLSEHVRDLVQQLHELLQPMSWFGNAKREESITNLLDQIGIQEEPAAVFAVARCLFSKFEHVRITASRTVHRLLSVVSPDQLIHLSGAIGWTWGWCISDTWEKLSPTEVSALLVDPETQTAVLGLLSFHRNGYVRQEAVRLLARAKDGTELPFLLIRQNDWVNVIGVEAQQAVNERLTPEYLPFFVRSLPLVIHLLTFRRRDLSPVVRRIVEMLVQPQHDTLLAEVVGASNRRVRRHIVQIALDVPGEHPARVILHGLRSPDPICRLACAKRIQQVLSGEELLRTIARLRQDRFMPVRREGFRCESSCFPENSVPVWEKALVDPSASIRELARYSMGKIGAFDAAAFYRQHLADQGVSFPVVCGLAECGDSTDELFLRGLLTHRQTKFRIAAIRGVARIAKERAVSDLVGCLTDRGPSVVSEATRRLEPFVSEVNGETLFAILRDGEAEFTRRLALQLINGKGKWQSLPWLIRTAFHADGETATQARRMVVSWFSPPLCNRVFTKPSAAERQEIEKAVLEFPGQKDDQFLASLRKWIQDT